MYPMKSVDVIFYDGKIITLGAPRVPAIAEAVAVCEGRIVAVGENREILGLAERETKRVGLEKKVVVPGFIDSHAHLHTAPDISRPSIDGATCIADIVKVVGDAVKKTTKGTWVITASTSVQQMLTYLREKRYPTRWDIDPVSPDNPVYITSGHYAVVNSYALNMLNISKDTPSPAGGEIGKDPKTGEPTGLLVESSATHLARKHHPPFTHEQWVEGIKKVCELFNSLGVTSIFNSGAYDDCLRACQELRSKGQLAVRVYTTYSIDFPTTMSLEEDLAIIQRIAAFASSPGFGDEFLKIGGIGEIVFNGVMPGDKLKKLSLEAAKYNLRVGVHSDYPLGAKATDELLSIWDEVNQEVPITDKRFIVMHGTYPSKENFNKVKSLKLAVSVQPCFLYHDPDRYAVSRTDPTRKAIPLRDWLDHGIRVGIGSDYPYGSWPIPNPMHGIYWVVTRRSKTGKEVYPDQKITREQALRAYTIDSAYVTFEEHIKGTIEPGKLADFAVLDKDILTCPEEEIKDIKAVMTVVGGKIVYPPT